MDIGIKTNEIKSSLDQMTSDEFADYLSTSDLADKHGIIQGAVYNHFIKVGWTEKKGTDRTLTDLGKEKSGKYKTSSCGKYSWIVWPSDILTEDDLKSIKCHASTYELKDFISTTKLAKKYDVQRKSLFSYLHKIGWIKRVNRSWEMTELGQKERAKLRPQYEFQNWSSLLWPDDLLENPIFTELLSGQSLKKNPYQEKQSDEIKGNILDKHSLHYSDYLSTSALAKKYRVNQKSLYEYLIEIGWTEKRGDERKLTELGEHHGGKYKTLNGINFWIVWPNDLLDDYIFKKLISERSVEQFKGKHNTLDDINKSNIIMNFGKYISTTALAKEMGVEGKKLIGFLKEIGWIEKRGNINKATRLGLSKGGKHHIQGGESYWVIWPPEIKNDPTLINFLDQSQDSSIFENDNQSSTKDFSSKIKTICEQRNIQRLIHFTRIDNLESILNTGLLSVHFLKTKGINFSPCDPDRYDGYLNAICLSISYPNYRMFYKKTQGDYSDWAFVILNPSILWNMDCAYCKTNAASSIISKENIAKLKTVEAFEALFSETYNQISRKDLNIHSFYTTDPQAEILVYNEIPIQYILALCFERRSYVPSDMFFWAKEVVGIPIEIGKKYFRPRMDWKFWKNPAIPTDQEMLIPSDFLEDIPF